MKIIGHRGVQGLSSENTLKGFKEAISHDVDEIEFDVRVTKDHIPVIHHGPEVYAPTGEKFPIVRHTLKSLQEQKTDLPTLNDVFDQVNKRVSLYIEIKPGVEIKPIIKILKSQLKKGYPASHMRIASFSQKTLLAIHKALPELPVIVIESWSGVRARRRADALQTKHLSMGQRWLRAGFVRSMHRRGYELYAYTINKPKKAARLHKHGLAGVVTDFPDRFKAK